MLKIHLFPYLNELHLKNRYELKIHCLSITMLNIHNSYLGQSCMETVITFGGLAFTQQSAGFPCSFIPVHFLITLAIMGFIYI